MNNKIRVGVVGGGIGKLHCEGYALLPDMFDLVGFCDLDERRRNTFKDAYNFTFVTDSFDALCARNDIDVINICTPPFLHFAQIEQALRAGKNVICEKPLVGSLQQIDHLRGVCDETGNHIMPVYQYRYGHGFKKFLHLKQAGILGRPFMANVEIAWQRGPEYFAVPWRGKMATHIGGCLVDQSIHMHDMVQQAMGAVKKVNARTRTLVNDVETEDCAAVILEMDNDSLVSESISLGAAEEKTRLKFMFENMTVLTDHNRPYKPQDEPWLFVPKDEKTANAMERVLRDFRPGYSGFAGLFEDYYMALSAGEDVPVTLPVTLDDAYASIELVTAMYASAHKERAVPLPLKRDDEYYAGWYKEPT